MTATINTIIANRELTANNHSLIRRLLHGHSSLVLRLGYQCQLEGHQGCVNCLEWSRCGTLLASGSDDLDVILWDPLAKKCIARIQTGHSGNIFSVKFLPALGNSSVLTCAEDHEVRHHDANTTETLAVWACSPSRVKRLAVSPQHPYLCWSAAEDGCIRQYDLRQAHSCQPQQECRNVLINLKSSCQHSQCKCLAVNPVRSEQIAVGCLDPYVRLYDTRMMSLTTPSTTSLASDKDPGCLVHFAPGHVCKSGTKRRGMSQQLATTYISFSPDGSELLVNLTSEHVYLYDVVRMVEPVRYRSDGNEQMCVASLTPRKLHDHLMSATSHTPYSHLYNGPLVNSSEVANVLKEEGNTHHKAGKYDAAIRLYSKAIQLDSSMAILYSNRAASYLGRKWDGDVYCALLDCEIALSLDPTHKKSQYRRINCLYELGWLEEARAMMAIYQSMYPGSHDKDFTAMQEKIEKQNTKNGHSSGEQHPVQIQCASSDFIRRFTGHCNAHTDIKEANFLGAHGDYIAAGSDDGNIFIWEKDTQNLVMILNGDDSIVNCIQWHPHQAILATSGIENVVRLWEPKPRDFVRQRLVNNSDWETICKQNQRRMHADPLEMMFLSLGYRIAFDPSNLSSGDDERASASNCRQA